MLLNDLTITGALAGLRKREFSCAELVAAHIEAAREAEVLNGFITTTFDAAEAQAKVADRKYADGTARPLEGIPIGYKDNFCTKGVRTTCASHILDNFVPHYNATAVEKLSNEAGAISLGKLSLDEFAMGSTNSTSYFGPVINPRRAKDTDDALVPGGSSGAPAALVAARVVMASTGSDTGGSIRQPASFTGTVGVKPTYGLCSRQGVIPLAAQLDTVGYFTRNIQDAAYVLNQLAGPDDADSTSAHHPCDDYTRLLGKGVKGVRIGVPEELEELLNDESKAIWHRSIEVLRSNGAEIVKITLPSVKHALTCYHVICTSQAASSLARHDGVRYGFRAEEAQTLDELYEMTRTQGFGTEVKRRIITGTAILASEQFRGLYTRTQKAIKILQGEFKRAFAVSDSIVMPTTLGGAFKIGAKLSPHEIYMNDYLTVAASMVGAPALSVPAALDARDLPVGLQIIHRHFDEAGLFAVSEVLEKELAVDTQVKKWWVGNDK